MSKYVIAMLLVVATTVGIAKALYDVTKPVGFVSSEFCKRLSQPCGTIAYGVTNEHSS